MKKMYALIALLGMIAVPGIWAAEEMYDAIGDGNAKKVKEMLESGVDANGMHYGEPFLVTASREGNVDIAQLLLASGAKIDAINACGDTALMKAAMFAHDSVVTLLLKRKANITIKASDGDSVLRSSCVREKAQPMRCLLLLHPDTDRSAIEAAYLNMKAGIGMYGPHLTTSRWLVHHAVKQAQAKKLIDSQILTKDARSVVIEYLGHYHDVPGHPLPATKPTDDELKETMAVLKKAEELYHGAAKE